MSLTATDLFCGAGGSSSGLIAAGVEVVMAANHWQLAVDTHNTNHPNTRHDCADISQVDPRRYPTTTIGWFSPSCTNHSIAKASNRQQSERIPVGALYPPLPEEASERSRATAWDVVRFSEYHNYKVVIVENVVDFAKWVLFDAWMMAMRNLGYQSQVVYLNSMFAGASPAPQSRDRVYVCFWKDRPGRRPNLTVTPAAFCEPCNETVNAVQSWKKPNSRWGRYRAQYTYRCPKCRLRVEPYVLPAASAIDWTIPGHRIGDRDKPLADGTMRRIQAGIDKFGGKGYSPLLIPVDRNGDTNKNGRDVWQPMATQTARATMGLAVPWITELRGGGSDARSVADPLCTVTASGNHHLLSIPPGFVMRNNGSRGEGGEHCTPFDEPLRTMTTLGHQSVVGIEPHLLVPYYRTGVAHPVTEPLKTVTTTDRNLLVGTKPDIADCTFRMLDPLEIQRAMAFSGDYTVLGNKRERVRQLGNAVTPPAAQVLVTAMVEMLEGKRVAA